MEDKLSEQKDIEENSTPVFPSSLSTNENLNRKYPYLTAFVGFIALYILSGIIAGLIFTIPLLIYSEIIGKQMYSSATPLFKSILQIVFGFYAFRYVVNKHILPYVNK
jgi:hypothetical protein